MTILELPLYALTAASVKSFHQIQKSAQALDLKYFSHGELLSGSAFKMRLLANFMHMDTQGSVDGHATIVQLYCACGGRVLFDNATDLAFKSWEIDNISQQCRSWTVLVFTLLKFPWNRCMRSTDVNALKHTASIMRPFIQRVLVY